MKKSNQKTRGGTERVHTDAIQGVATTQDQPGSRGPIKTARKDEQRGCGESLLLGAGNGKRGGEKKTRKDGGGVRHKKCRPKVFESPLFRRGGTNAMGCSGAKRRRGVAQKSNTGGLTSDP